MKAHLILLFLFLTVILISCDRVSTLTYKIKNIGADSIRIVTVRKNRSALMPDTFKISYNETVTIGVISKGSEHISKYKPNGALVQDFQSIDIYKVSNGVKAKTSFLQTAQWQYEEKGSRTADYTATVRDNDF